LYSALACFSWDWFVPSCTWDRSAYRFGGITLAIVLLIPRPATAWAIAFHRFAEVSIGLGVALILTVVWPEKDAPAPQKK
jgi:hypothetical protein